MINLLFIADVIGSPGRDVVRALLPEMRRRLGLHLVVCNGENSAAGFGLTREVAKDLYDAGVDVLTGGNHLWDKKDSFEYLGEEPRLVRPANLPAGTPGEGWRVFKAADGTEVTQVQRTLGLAAESVASGGVHVVPDLREDERGSVHPLVAADPALRAYAAAPLTTYDGHTIGVLAVLDHRVRTFDERELGGLADLAAIAMRELELRLVGRGAQFDG